MMNLNALKIDPEFQGKIPPLNFEEEQQLEQNILHEGRLLNPIIIWNGFILDGHTRYRILRKHPFIAYQIQEIELANRYAALSWICQNQLGRRNLDPEQKKFLMGKLYESEKLARGGSKERAHDENGRFTSMVQNDPLRAKRLSTCERIAAQNGVGPATVKRAEKYAKGVDAAEDAVPGARRQRTQKSPPWQKCQKQKFLLLLQNCGSQSRNVSPEKLKQLLQNKRFLKSAKASKGINASLLPKKEPF